MTVQEAYNLIIWVVALIVGLPTLWLVIDILRNGINHRKGH